MNARNGLAVTANDAKMEVMNRAEIIDVLVKYTRIPQPAAAATYDLFIERQVIAREAGLFEDGIKANFDALIAMGDLAQPPPLAGFIALAAAAACDATEGPCASWLSNSCFSWIAL